MRVNVDMSLCESHGECVFLAPDVFSFDDDGTLRWSEQVDDARRAELERAARACPTLAIRIAP